MTEIDLPGQDAIGGYGPGKQLYAGPGKHDWLATYRQMNGVQEWAVWSATTASRAWSEAEANEEMYRQAAVRLLTR